LAGLGELLGPEKVSALVPAKELTTLPNGSTAETETVRGVPTVGVEVEGVSEKPLIAAGVMINWLEAEVRPATAPVMVGLAAAVSPYQNVTEDCPAGMVTDVTAAEPAELEKLPFPEVVVRATVSGMIVGVPLAASSVTVIGPMLVVDEAVPELTPLENTSFVGLSRIVSAWVAVSRPVDDAVMVGVPTVLSP
jgi:hypothetical protein